MARHAESIELSIRSRIFGNGGDWVFTPRHFQDLGSDAAIDSALRWLKAAGAISQLARSLYRIPCWAPSPLRSTPSPAPCSFGTPMSSAIRGLRWQSARSLRAGALAQRLLSDGPTRKARSAGVRSSCSTPFRATWPPPDEKAARSFQALRYLGKDQVDYPVIATLGRHRPVNED